MSTGVCAEHGPWLASDWHGCPYCPKPSEHSAFREFVGDARAQLWARAYRDELKLWRICLTPRGETPCEAHLQLAQGWARKVAAEAVRDFDEHYLGGKR